MSVFTETLEIDVPRCTLSYGVGACQASGGPKCYQAPETCQDASNFSPEVQTVRIITSSEGHTQPEDLESFPHLKSAKINPQQIRPGEDLGKRERITFEMQNGPDDDSFFDKYLDERDFSPYEQGTLFGRFHARYPNVKGYQVRYYYGDSDVPLSERKVRHYIAHSSQLTNAGQAFEIEAKDALDMIEGKKYLFPTPSNALLDEDIGTGLVSFDLKPAGIGADLPESGKAAIEKEVVEYTRSGDIITLTSRAIDGSELEEHEADSTFQNIGVLSGTASDILSELVGPLVPEFAINNKSAWDSELITANRTNFYYGEVGEPTEHHKLINDLMRDVGLDVHMDIEARKVIMNVIRKRPSTFFASSSNVFDIDAETNHDNVISAVYVQYGRVNPLEKLDEGQNYSGRFFQVDPDPKMQIMNNTPKIKSHQSRYIPRTGRFAVEGLALLILGRYHKPLKSVRAFFPWDDAPKLGDVGNAQCRLFENFDGSMVDFFQVQVVEAKPDKGKIAVMLQQYSVDSEPNNNNPNLRVVPIDEQVFNINLREWYDNTYSDAPPAGSEVQFVTTDGIIIGSESTGEFSIIDGDWPEVENDNVTLKLIGLVSYGKGGLGAMTPGFGGPALYVRTEIECINCEFGGGGGGGAGALYTNQFGSIFSAIGGGGAGVEGGSGFEDGTATTGGAGENNDEQAIGGDGGDIGETGGTSSDGSPGAPAGVAIDGVSYVTLTNTTIHGQTVN